MFTSIKKNITFDSSKQKIMTALELLKSISKNSQRLETVIDGELISLEMSGWMSKKQADFLISLMQKEGVTENLGFEFGHKGYTIKRPMANGARAWSYYNRKEWGLKREN